jgi:hypothetical protein
MSNENRFRLCVALIGLTLGINAMTNMMRHIKLATTRAKRATR